MIARRFIIAAVGWVALAGPVCADITTGLIRWYKLDDGSGSSAADNGSDNSGGTIVASATWTTGQISGGLSVPFSTGGLSLARPALTSCSAFSVACWIHTNSPANFCNFAGQWDNGASNQQWFWRSNGSGGMQMYAMNAASSSIDATIPAGSINANAYNHYVMVCDGTTLRTYINGAASSTASLAGPYIPADTNAADWHFGSGSRSANDSTTAKYDEARIYNRALSAGDVTELFNYDGTGGGGGGTPVRRQAIVVGAALGRPRWRPICAAAPFGNPFASFAAQWEALE